MGIVKILTVRNSKLRARAENAEVRVRRAKIIADRDNELEAQTDSHRAEVKRELEDTGESDTFRKPDKLWDD